MIKQGKPFSFGLLAAACLASLPALAADGVPSGLKPGMRPGPYAAVICTGPERGRSHCYVCETADRPAVIVFARRLDEPLGRLVQRIDRLVAEHKKAELRAWVTLLHPDQAAIDAQVVAWGKKHALRNVPVGVFEDPAGPPSYRLAPEAEVTVLLSVRQRVVANFAFGKDELTGDAIARVEKALPRILDAAK